MADSLAIITGVFAIVFLMFYLSSLLSKEHDLARLTLIVMGLFFITFIPGQFQVNDPDCGILSDGSYVCYLSNGSQVSDFGEGNTIGKDAFRAWVGVLIILSIYVLYYLGRKGLELMGALDRWGKTIGRRMRK